MRSWLDAIISRTIWIVTETVNGDFSEPQFRMIGVYSSNARAQAAIDELRLDAAKVKVTETTIDETLAAYPR